MCKVGVSQRFNICASENVWIVQSRNGRFLAVAGELLFHP